MAGAAFDPEDREDDQGLLAEINVTPFVDVMLVLLIVFMVAAPLMTVGVPVDVPRQVAGAQTTPAPAIVLSLDAEGRLWIGDETLEPADLPARLALLAAEAPDRPVQIRADRSLPYGTVMRLLGQVAASGLARVSLIGREAP
ncbi:MAG: biopolymer transporter ExbD [Elioraea sp.]|nr:biopolymer transporter ExbD [Elioraea sp.]